MLPIHHSYETNAQDVIVRVRGLPFNVQYREIRAFFAPAHIVSNGVHLLYDQYVSLSLPL